MRVRWRDLIEEWRIMYTLLTGMWVPLWRLIRGRWHIFRDSSDAVVEAWASGDPREETGEMKDLICAAKEELHLRRRRRFREGQR